MRCIGLALLLASCAASATCVVSQSSAQYVRVLDSTTLVLYGGAAGHTLIKTLTPILPGAQFSVAKDNFCDFDNAAIYMDGQPVTIQQVAHVY